MIRNKKKGDETMIFEDIEVNLIRLLKTIGFTLFQAPAKDYPKKTILYFKGRKKDDWCIKIEFGHTKEIIGSTIMSKQVKELLQFVPEGVDLESISEINYPKKHFGKVFVKGDEHYPFFSEAYLYNLLGKEDARTLTALLRNALISLGISREELEEKL